jgi:hypothetical protein
VVVDYENLPRNVNVEGDNDDDGDAWIAVEQALMMKTKEIVMMMMMMMH